MTLNELRYIVAVAQERNFRRAAEKSFISQPALSLAIQKLEEELGIKIFERGKSEVSITPVGAEIVEQAQRALEEVARIRELARQGRPVGQHVAPRYHLQRRALSAARPGSRAEEARTGDAAGDRGEYHRES